MNFDYYRAQSNNKIVGRFGVEYLDKTLTGIMRGDLVVIGSRAGAGKSTLANMIARANKKQHKVALFSLENFEDDLPMEQAYRYFLGNSGIYCSMRDFASGQFVKRISDPIRLKNLIKECESYANAVYDGINVYNRKAGYTIENLSADMIAEAEKGTELLVIDHLTYVDKLYNESDVEHMTTLMRTIRQIQDEQKIAVVGISHLRKPLTNLKEPPVVPSMDEFMGSSNVVKEATVCVLLAPDDDQNKKNAELGCDRLKRTWCCIRKNRYGGISNKAANLFFDTVSGEYTRNYDMYSINYSGTKTEFIESVQNEDF